MINECQQLLRLFGLPYITAPMEAEAQCAELVSLGLVDGIVTDDSDTFLFGGTRVYKNMFNQSKFVECYLSSDFEKEYALHRRKLISFAHLLGSDYTEGIPGIGPVKALEIITEFSNLEEFREWWTELQIGVNKPDDAHLAFRKKFRKQASKIFLPPSFPDTRVDTAYLEPEVDADSSQFQWGVPDLNGLRHFLMSTIGWSQERTDEVLVPVIRDMNRRAQEGTQSNITQFMQGSIGAGAFAPRVRGGPSRMEKAFGRLRQEAKGGREAAHGEESTAAAATDTAAEDRAEEGSSSGKRGKATQGGASKKRKTRRESSAT
jgi:DNA excision repair protein ERCC-5